jgi:cyclase
VIASAEKLGAQYVLPGHGPSGGPEILTGQASFMIELRKAVEQAVAQGKKLDDIVTMKEGKPAATSIKLPPSVDNWVGDGLAGQVANAYNEITQKKPVGDIPHS